MATIGRWTGDGVNLFPVIGWTTPNGLFPDEERNDSSAYSIDSSTSTITLPSSNLADGYLVVARLKISCTHNNRANAAGRLALTSGTGEFNTVPSAGYERNNANNEMYISVSGIYNNPSPGAQIMFDWNRDSGNGTPAGIVNRSVFEIIPLYYSNIAMYSDTLTEGASGELELYGGTTPNVMSLKNTILETSSTISRTGDTITLSGTNKRYLISSGYLSTGRGGARTQKWLAHSYDGTVARSAMAYMYIRNSVCDLMGVNLMDIIEVGSSSVEVELNMWDGDGTSPTSLGGCSVSGNSPNFTNTRLTIIELNDSAEVFKSENTNNQTICATNAVNDVSLVDVNLINDSASFTPSTVSKYLIESNMDAFIGSNISAAYPASSTTRNTGQTFLSIDDSPDVSVFHGNFARGSQGNQNTFGFSMNPFGYAGLTQNQQISFTSNGVGDSGVIQTNPSWAGMYGLNLDTLQQPTRETKFYIIS